MSTEPKLAAPGAGLPAPQLFVARKLFALKCRMGKRSAFLDHFREEQLKIRSLLDTCAPEKRGERVLVPRMRGLEDSSRYWSLWMTLDHLRIVNDAIAGTMEQLCQGNVPPDQLSTADVKPDPQVSEVIETDFEQSCDEFLKRITSMGELKNTVRYHHPWFGPLDAFQWLALASMHMSIHRAQIAAILRHLNP